MSSLTARFSHSGAPGKNEEVAAQVDEILQRPFFSGCRRASAMRRDRQTAFAPLAPGLVRDYLVAPENDLVILDNGRRGELDTMVALATGRKFKGDADRPAPFTSYVIVPLSDTASEGVNAFCELALALRTVAGAVTAEPSFGEAQGFALSVLNGGTKGPGTGRATVERVKERLSHYFHPAEVAGKIPGPEWGLFLGEGHLKVMSVERLRASRVFAEVRSVASGLALALLTLDPADALSPDFDQTLRAAREVLAPILMDWSHVPDGALK